MAMDGGIAENQFVRHRKPNPDRDVISFVHSW
jgi:hypothetical protein